MPGQRVPDDRPAEVSELRLERVGSARGSGLRALVVASVIVGFIGLALAKPWVGPAPSASGLSERPSSGPPSDGPAAEIAPLIGDVAPWVATPYVVGPTPVVAAAAVRAAVRSRDDWGIRAVVEERASQGIVGSPLLVERWQSGGLDQYVAVSTGSAAIRALGVSAPAGVLIVDVRVRALVDGREHWLDVEPVDGGNPGSEILVWPPRVASGWLAAWPAGTYRFEILTAAGIGLLGVQLTGPGGTLTLPSGDGRVWAGSTAGGAPRGLSAAQAGLWVGVVAAADVASPAATSAVPTSASSVLPLGGRATAGLGYGAAWLDTVAGQGSTVAAYGVTAYLPGAVSLGVVGPDGMSIEDARLVRLHPGPSTASDGGVGRASPVVTTLSRQPLRQSVRFDEPDGAAWEPGSYAIVVEGTVGASHDGVAYMFTLLPGSARHTSAPLAATRAWARFAGRWGIAAGLLDPLDAPGRLAIRYAATGPETILGGGADYTHRCLEVNLVDSTQPILGVGHPAGIRPGAVEVQRVYLDGSVTLARPATALTVLPGLTLVAAGEGSAWAPGWYRLIVHTDTTSISLPVCVGSAGPGYLAVPGDAGLRPGPQAVVGQDGETGV